MRRADPVIVLGTDRSGTSLVADIVRRWGAYAGPADQLMPADESNEQGYWELRSLQGFLDELLERATQLARRHTRTDESSSVGSIWEPHTRSSMRSLARDSELRGRANDLVEEMSRPGTPWFWKEPLLCHALPFWEQLWHHPTYLVTVRNPFDSARSYQQYNLPSGLAGGVSLIGYGLIRWQAMMVPVLRSLGESSRTLFVSYEGLLASPTEQCERVDDFLSHCFEDLPGSDGGVERMAGAINPRLHHQRSNEHSLGECGKASEQQLQLYDLLVRLSNDERPPIEPRAYDIDGCAAEYLTFVDAFFALFGARKCDYSLLR